MKRFPLLALTLVASLSLAACSDELVAPATSADGSAPSQSPGRSLAPSDMTIAEIAEDGGFTLLLGAVNYIAADNPESPLIAGLLDRDQYTVFAPTDDAFLALVDAVDELVDPEVLANDGPFAAIDDLLGAGTVEAVVGYHVTGGRRAARSVVPKDGERVIETLLDGATFSVSTTGMITAVGNTARIAAADISASNGIVHVIDTVILPVDLGL